MIRGIYTAVSGLITQEARQDVISNNLANANTVAYKKENLIAKKFDDVMIQNYDKVVNGKNVKNVIGSLSMGSKIDETYAVYDEGVIETTGKDTDFAIQGQGFFSVIRDNGINENTYYTRDGHFHINGMGYLVNDTGDRVLGKNSQTGVLEPIYVGNGKVKCDENGNMFINNRPSYKLYTTDFDDYNSLKKVEDNLYTGENPTEINNNKLHQGCLEKSNVDVMREMVDMMMTIRTFESNQKVVQTLDETLGKAVNEVGRV
ncbi:flagellar hook-basal body complex protein [Clostridium sp. ZS2-4]|uniref:flagellar hook-basal body complex protein n=1 Tax=Clostridium sp. ZS2-4 TaxID=2987703 RepID=UPI00227B3DE9|nr:flagellar hook-basal body complex protein [Clostridium sp. ZS2-4]MCY6354024.1 flagellar hook-basal body complex protein [Clostridium sp. ZS2-4]